MNFLKCHSGSCVAVNGEAEIFQISLKRSSFVFNLSQTAPRQEGRGSKWSIKEAFCYFWNFALGVPLGVS